MGLMESAAHLRVCPRCSGHGKVVFADGPHEDVLDKHGARRVAVRAIAEGRMSPEELVVLEDQIASSSLCENLPEMLLELASVMAIEQEEQEDSVLDFSEFSTAGSPRMN